MIYLLIYSTQYSVELRELEAKLKAGYMNRERAAQLAEKRLLEIEEQVGINLDINWLSMWVLCYHPMG